MIGDLVLTPFDAASILIVLAAALGHINFRFLARRALPTRLRADDNRQLWIITHPVRFAGFVDRVFGALAETDCKRRLRDGNAWLGGTA